MQPDEVSSKAAQGAFSAITWRAGPVKEESPSREGGFGIGTWKPAKRKSAFRMSQRGNRKAAGPKSR